MAKIKRGVDRETAAGYHIYRQPTPSGELLTIRRKVATPTDVDHKSSRATRLQRLRFSNASKRWARLPGIFKTSFSNTYGIVVQQKPHGLSTVKVLKGSQLFISQEIHQVKFFNEHVVTPVAACVVACDDFERAIHLPLKARYDNILYGLWVKPAYITIGNTYFYDFPTHYGLYYIGYAVPGWEPSQVHRVAYDDLLKMTYLACYPPLKFYEKFEWSWWWRTPWAPDPLHPGSTDKNIEALKTAHVSELWHYAIHPMKEIFGQDYYNHVAYKLYITKRDETHFRLQLERVNFTNDFRIECQTTEPEKVIWTVTKGLFGIWNIDPPQTTAIIQTYPPKVVSYE